jgi:predicted transcriptional regulator
MANDTSIAECTTQIVSAFLQTTDVHHMELPDVVRAVKDALTSVDSPDEDPSYVDHKRAPIDPSALVANDWVQCAACGFRGVMLKRHIERVHQMTPDQYRNHFHLSPKHPITAPNYSVTRSDLAKAAGLGLDRGKRKPRRR